MVHWAFVRVHVRVWLPATVEIERAGIAELRQRVELLEELRARGDTPRLCSCPAVAAEYVVQPCVLEFAERLSEPQAELVADHQAFLGMKGAEDFFMFLATPEHPTCRNLRASRLHAETCDKEV